MERFSDWSSHRYANERVKNELHVKACIPRSGQLLAKIGAAVTHQNPDGSGVDWHKQIGVAS